MTARSHALHPVLKMYDTVDQVKVHKASSFTVDQRALAINTCLQQRCKHLRNQCVETLNALGGKGSQLEGSTQLQEALDIFET